MQSYGNKTDKKLDELITKVLATKDPAEWKRLALEATVMAKDRLDVIPILDVRTIYAVGTKVGDIKPTVGMSGLSAALETITLAK